MSKFNSFIEDLVNTIAENDTTVIKDEIGDSTENHRTVTVRQLTRYLYSTKQNKLANNLWAVYTQVKPRLQSYRNRRSVTRNDAYDVNEFLTVLTNIALKGSPLTKQQLSKAIV